MVNVFAGEPPRERSAGGIGSRARPTRPRRSARVSRRIARHSRSLAALPSTCRSWIASTASPTRRLGRDRRGAARSGRRGRAGCTRRPSLGDHHRDHTAVRAAALALHAEGARRGAVRGPSSRHRVRMAAVGARRRVIEWCGSSRRAMGEPARGHRHPGRADAARRAPAAGGGPGLQARRGAHLRQSDSAPAARLRALRWKILSCSASRSIGGCR